MPRNSRCGSISCARAAGAAIVYELPQAIGEVRYDDSLSGVKAECAAFECLKARPNAFIEIFMTAVSPGFIATSMMNNYYDNHEAYVFASPGS